MDEENVGYSLRDILIRVDKKLDTIGEKLEQKAERSRVHDLAETVGIVAANVQVLDKTTVKKDGPEMERLRELEDSRSESSGERSYKRFLWPVVAMVVGALWWLPAVFGHTP
jgi:hypothetical protein